LQIPIAKQGLPTTPVRQNSAVVPVKSVAPTTQIPTTKAVQPAVTTKVIPTVKPIKSPSTATTTVASITPPQAKPLASAEELAKAKVGSYLVCELGGCGELLLCGIPAGTFTMPKKSGNCVTLTKNYWLGRTQVTQEQWQILMGDKQSVFRGADLPVHNVSWDDAMKFCDKLNTLLVPPSGWKWALPSEAQWEYACRAGTTGEFAGVLEEMAWYADNSGRCPKSVATKKPNAWGLYDMHGNVWEWCHDWYTCRHTGDFDPIELNKGSRRVYRGGSWLSGSSGCGSGTRDWTMGAFKPHEFIGFRVAVVQLGP